MRTEKEIINALKHVEKERYGLLDAEIATEGDLMRIAEKITTLNAVIKFAYFVLNRPDFESSELGLDKLISDLPESVRKLGGVNPSLTQSYKIINQQESGVDY